MSWVFFFFNQYVVGSTVPTPSVIVEQRALTRAGAGGQHHCTCTTYINLVNLQKFEKKKAYLRTEM